MGGGGGGENSTPITKDFEKAILLCKKWGRGLAAFKIDIENIVRFSNVPHTAFVLLNGSFCALTHN